MLELSSIVKTAITQSSERANLVVTASTQDAGKQQKGCSDNYLYNLH